MLSEVTRAVVLKTSPYSNTSLVVTFYTEKYGKLVAMAKGARNRQRTVEGAIETLSLGEAVFYLKKGRGMATLKEYEAYEDFIEIRKSLERFHTAEGVLEYLLEGVADYEREFELFSITVAAFDAIAKGHPYSALAAFLIQALSIGGVFPSVTSCSACGNNLSERSPLAYSTFKKTFLCEECLGKSEHIKFPPQVRTIVNGILHLGTKIKTVRLPTNVLPHLFRLTTTIFELNFGRRLWQTEKLIPAVTEI
ncbi:MAG: DNA repair protein RecO [Planctomycetota bacterium]|nr:DNA repair protein RecO [Planctomycetota bacterium]